MNNNNRNYIDAVLVVALIILGVFLFNRVQNLNTTQTELADAQAEITQVANEASTYAEAGTALADSAAADARNAADELSYANSTATEAANNSIATLASANAAGTRVAADSADALNEANAALDSANSTATQAAADSADMLSNANSTATSAANVARTEAANVATQQAAAQAENEALSANLEDVEATNSAALELQATGQAERENLEDEVAALSTTQAGLETLANAQMTAIASLNTQLNTAYVQRETQATAIAQAEATIAAQADIIDSAPATPADDTVAEATPSPQTNTKGLVLFETNTVQIYLPPDYVAIDPTVGLDAALDVIRDMGPEYEQSAEFISQNADSIEVWAARDELSADGFLENMMVFNFDTLVEVSLQSFMDFGYQGLPSNTTITEQVIIELNGQEVLRTRLDSEFDFFESTQVQYAFASGTHIYLVVMTTSSADFESRQDLFEAVAATFIIRE